MNLKEVILDMVLTYDSTLGNERLILDNIVNTVKPASKRSDLIPIIVLMVLICEWLSSKNVVNWLAAAIG
ncbi:hypothetical protein ACFLZQ_08610 [Thermodesulfobacteriota bacterium]